MNKAGKGGSMKPFIVTGVIVMILLLGIVAYGTVKNAALSDKDATTDTSVAVADTTLSATGDCNTAPSVVESLVNALQTGSSFAATTNYTRVNGKYKGTDIPSTLAYGDDVEVIFAHANYIDKKFTLNNLNCGSNALNADLYATDDPTVRIFNTDGDKVGNSVTAVCAINALANQSSSTGTITMKIEIQSASLQSSGDLVAVVEVDNKTEIAYDKIVMTGNGVSDASVPTFYSPNATTSVIRAFNLPASVNGALTTYYLELSPKDGQALGPAGSAGTYAIFNLYSKQDFVDVDGSFQYGIENSRGTTQYEDTSSFGICIIGS